jgi:hypothetical protein
LGESVEEQTGGHGQPNLLRFPSPANPPDNPVVAFDRRELTQILDLYGRYVAAGEWRDYAMDFGKSAATFSIFRHASEQPLYRIVKNPDHIRKQGAYAVIAQGGLILKRGQDLAQVLRVLIKKPRLA